MHSLPPIGQCITCINLHHSLVLPSFCFLKNQYFTSKFETVYCTVYGISVQPSGCTHTSSDVTLARPPASSSLNKLLILTRITSSLDKLPVSLRQPCLNQSSSPSSPSSSPLSSSITHSIFHSKLKLSFPKNLIHVCCSLWLSPLCCRRCIIAMLHWLDFLPTRLIVCIANSTLQLSQSLSSSLRAHHRLSRQLPLFMCP